MSEQDRTWVVVYVSLLPIVMLGQAPLEDAEALEGNLGYLRNCTTVEPQSTSNLSNIKQNKLPQFIVA